MFSSFTTSNQYDGRTKIKRQLFSKGKTHSTSSESGIDLKKIKVKFTEVLNTICYLY